LERKLVCLDIDGTLIGSSRVVPASAVEACKEARRRGHALYICSGRNMPEVMACREIVEIGFDGIISSGGARVEINGKAIFSEELSAEIAKKVYQYLDGLGCGIALERKDAILSNRRNVKKWQSILDAASDEERELFSGLLETKLKNPLPEIPEERHYENVNKIVFNGGGPGCLEGLRRAFSDDCEIFENSIPMVGNEGGEIGPKGIHKGYALGMVAQFHGIAPADTIAFGDGDNDSPMIAAAGVGVAMGNGSESLKAMADMVTAAVEDDGIFKGFKKLGLI